MNDNRSLIIQQKRSRASPFLIGSFLGTGAALVGVSALVAGLRPWHLLVISAFVLAVSRVGVSSVSRLRVNSFDILFMTFVLLSACVEYLNASQLNFDLELISVFTDLFYVLAYATVRLTVSNIESCAQLLRGVVWPALPMSVLGVLQLLGVDIVIRLSTAIAPTNSVENRLERGDSLRAWGLTGHWTGYGGYLTCVVAALICIMLIDRQSQNRIMKTDVASLGILLSGVLATLTFSVVISALAIVLLSWKKLKAGVNGVIAITLVAMSSILMLRPFLAGRFDQQFDPSVSAQDLPPWLPSTIAYRFVIWERETIPALLERPFIGWGSGAYGGGTVGRIYPVQLNWLSAESQWFSIAVGYGIIVTSAFALLIVAAGMMFLRAKRISRGPFFDPFIVLWISLFLTSFTVAIFTNRGTPSVFYILLGCAAAVHSNYSSKTETSSLKSI